MKQSIFVISPVRNIPAETYEAIQDHVFQQEHLGHKVYWPARDTNQDDQVGLRICSDNRDAIYKADTIHLWFDKNSQGSVFDMGMLFYFLKEIHRNVVIINADQVWPFRVDNFEFALLELGVWISEVRRWDVMRSKEIRFDLDTNSNDCLFYMGMVFASLRNRDKKIILLNRDQIQRTPHKSFENVFLELSKHQN